MSFKNPIRFASLFAALFVFTGIAAAQGPTTGPTATAELAMSAVVATSVQLNIETDPAGATVISDNDSGLNTINFGTINGMGTGTPSNGVTVDADATGALYKTPITLIPVFSGYTTETADVSVDNDGTGDFDLAREGSAAITSTDTVLVSHVAFSNAASDSENTRWIGFYIPRIEPAGAKTATLIYTVTMAN